MASKPAEYISGPAGPSITIEGLEETMAMFEDLPKALILAGFTGALNAAADVLAGELDARTPIRLGFEGGELTVEGGALEEALMREITLDANYRGGLAEIGYGKLGYIANFVEYGHVMLSHRKKPIEGPRTPGGMVAAHPFMRPAFDVGKERAIDAFTDSIHSTLENFKAKWGMPKAA